MNKFYTIITTTLLLLALGACSETDPMDKPDTEKEELAINAGVVTTVVTSRADDPAFTENFDLFMNQTAPDATPDLTSHTKYDAVYDTGFTVYEAGSTTDIWYWDDNGGHSAVVTLRGIYPKNNMTVDQAFATEGFDWTVKADQSGGEDYTASDLLISDRLADYKLVTQKTGIGNLVFKHRLSKLTFILKKGTGFKDDGSDFNPSLTTVALKPTANVKIATDNDVVTIAPDGTAAPITPNLVKLDATTKQKTLAAIVVPGQTIAQNSQFATIQATINESVNSYPVELPSTVTADITFEPGKNYIFEILVHKTGALVSATVVDWDDTPPPVEKTVKISVDGNIALDNDDIVDGASLHIKVSKGATPIEVAGLRSMTTYNKSTDDWADLSPVLYWDDIPVSTTTIANAILFNKAGGVSVINDNPEYIYQGNSQTLDAAVTFLRFEDMIHPFSKVNIKIRTEKGANKVDLTKLTNITFYSTIQQFSSIGIQTDATASTQAITYKTNEDSNVLLSISSPSETTEGTPIYEYYDVDPIYIKPIATIASDKELLRIFYGDGDIKNEYPLILNAGVTFEKNKKYDIVVTLKKTEIAEVSVSIMPWGDGGTIDGGEAGIDK